MATTFLLQPDSLLAAPFRPGNIVVARVGEGSERLTNAATAVFLDEYTPNGMLVQTINLPTSVSDNNRALTASGTATSELNLTRSADGRYLVLAGYGATPGEANISASESANVTRVIGRIAADGTFDTSTSTGDAFDKVSIRAAATADGLGFYAVGANSGVRYVPFGGFASTILSAQPATARYVNTFGGNLYVTTTTSPYAGLSQVGTGLPTIEGQVATLLPGFPGAVGAGPNAFYLADLNATVPGVDVLYLASDSAPNGIQKWSLVEGTWVLNGVITSASGLRGLMGTSSGTAVSLAASGTGGLFFASDEAGYNAAPSLAALPAAIATAGANTAFRGVAFAPVAAAPVAAAPAIASFTPASGPVGTTVTLTGTDFTGATAVALNGVVITGFTVASATSITFDVPAGASSGAIAVTTPSGTATSTNAFTVTVPNPAPTIASLAPATAVAGSGAFTLTVTGTGFVTGSVVSFNGAALLTTLVSATQLTAAVPAEAIATAGTYNVVVTSPAPGGGASAAAAFSVTVPAPTITSFTPTGGSLGTLITLTGTNFTGATAVSIGSFAIPTFTVVSATSITFVVPDGLSSGNTGTITVVTPGGTATSSTSFNLVLAAQASQALPGLKVFPNPATDRLTVTLPTAGAATVALRDLTSRVVLAPAALPADQQLRLPAALAAGVYLLEVRQGSRVAVRRIQKN